VTEREGERGRGLQTEGVTARERVRGRGLQRVTEKE